jgi:hypothetical protein
MFDVGDAPAPLTPARKAPNFHPAEFFAIMGFGDLWHGRDASNASIPAPLVVFVAPADGVFPVSKTAARRGRLSQISVHHSPGIAGQNRLRWNGSGGERFIQG